MNRLAKIGAQCALALLAVWGLGGCGRHSGSGGSPPQSEGHWTDFNCGATTYRIDPDRIDGAVKAACEHVKESAALLVRYGVAARVRYTCARSDGHVVQSLMVTQDLLDDYNKGCQQFLSSEAAAVVGPGDRDGQRAKITALCLLNDESNNLTRRFAQDANRDYGNNKAAQDALNQLIGDRGGSIKIAAPRTGTAGRWVRCRANGRPLFAVRSNLSDLMTRAQRADPEGICGNGVLDRFLADAQDGDAVGSDSALGKCFTASEMVTDWTATACKVDPR
jgi:hypothetical protein